MFVVSIIKDTVAIQPINFDIPVEDAIIDELNKKYANRVLHDVGLCICVLDLSKVGEGKVRYGDGMLWYKVEFRLVVFRPFQGEVLLAKVKSSDETGIRLTLQFFDDIKIPAKYIPHPSAFDPNERAFFWVADNPDLESQADILDSHLDSRLWIEDGAVIRVRVESDEFYDDEPGPPKHVDGVQVLKERRRPPYSIVCSIAEQGLGPVAWWDAPEAEDSGEGMEEG